MISVHELRAQAHDVALARDVSVGTIMLGSGDPAAPALEAAMAYFGADVERPAIRLVVDGEESGFLEPEDIYPYAASGTKGFGESGYATIPGAAPASAYRFFELRCPLAGCPASPVFTPSYDRDDPPACPAHGDQVLRPAS